jgi:hypothetical protein
MSITSLSVAPIVLGHAPSECQPSTTSTGSLTRLKSLLRLAQAVVVDLLRREPTPSEMALREHRSADLFRRH